MGTGSSFLRSHQDEDDVLGTEYAQDGVIKRIPIEVKPRGKLGLRSVSSFGKKQKNGSLRSALSVELESPEVEKIRREFEMYRMHKEQELSSISKKESRLSTENKRLRSELLAIQKTCKKLREERDSALEAEHQALVRAAAFETDRDKIQRQFKLFRETKENEIQTMLRARRDLEGKLSKISSGTLEDTDTFSRFGLEATLGMGTAGDWWTALESEPSLGSTTQLHTSGFRGPELAHSLMESDGPFTNVNKDDWTAAAASLAHLNPAVNDLFHSNMIYLYISAPPDAQDIMDKFCKEFVEPLGQLCKQEARCLIIVHIPHVEHTLNEQMSRDLMDARRRRIEQTTIFLAFLEEKIDTCTECEIQWGHLDNPGVRPAIFAFKYSLKKQKNSQMEQLHRQVIECGSSRLIEGYRNAQNGIKQAGEEVEKMIKVELGIENPREKDLAESVIEYEGPEVLCGGILWDPKNDLEQAQALAHAAMATCELRFEQYYERLHAHVSAPGPQAPMLIIGKPGCGKSLLLAKWFELQQQRSTGTMILYHFVESKTAITADPIVMIRRLTAQLLQQVSMAPGLTCDPARLVDEFPRWLEKVSAKMGGGIIMLLDSIDRLQQCETQLKWLLDPLPVDLRIIMTTDGATCPQPWRAWPTLHMEEMSPKDARELLHAEMASVGHTLPSALETRVLSHCCSAPTTRPLYVVLLACQLARLSCDSDLVDLLLNTADTTQLYKVSLHLISQRYLVPGPVNILRQVLQLIYISRSGLSEKEIMGTVKNISWAQWAPLREALLETHVLTTRSGLLVLAHPEARDAVWEMFFDCEVDGDGSSLQSAQITLRDYFNQYQSPVYCTYRVADELCWLNRKLGDKAATEQSIWNLCIFLKLYGRGRCSEIVGYWQYVGKDKCTMARMYQDALKQMESMVGQMNGLITLPRIADCYEALGRFLRDLNMLSESLTPLQRALEIRETALDPDHPSVAQTLHQVAGVHAQQSRFSAAEALYKQSLEIYEGAFGRDHFLVAKELDALAVLYQKQGKHDLSEPIHRRAMSIRRKTKTPRVTSGHMRSVEPIKRRALQLEELALGPDSADLARSLNELGVLYYLQNNIESAESFFRRALEMRENILGEDHTDTAQSLNNLAALYNDTKQFDKAQQLYERALQIRRKLYPLDHPSVSSVINHLAMLYKKMGQFDKAEPLYRQSVEIRETAFSPGHPAVATALVNLAVLYSQQSKYVNAEPLCDRALHIYETSLGPHHPRVAETHKNLALLKYDQGDFETAARLYKRATEIKENDLAYGAKAIASRRSSGGASR